jgi:mannose-6-phosphate isomerase
MLYPLKFKPIFKERVWGGRKLAELYQKPLPGNVPIGESWEISDRPGDASVISNGPLAGKDLHWLMENHSHELLGEAKPTRENRFPLLLKLLDAREKLSLQVHPPASKAAELGGEPKTEMWYIADADPGAELYVGLKRGVTRTVFEKKIETGEVAECFHRVPVRAGDVMFLPSGRVHAIGAGLVIFEIQQNSDTTYRVFDWNRAGLDGKPRELHVKQSLASINFEDFEPELTVLRAVNPGASQAQHLVKSPLFCVDLFQMKSAESIVLGRTGMKMKIVAVLKNRLTVSDGQISVELRPGEVCLVPSSVKVAELFAESGASFLLAGSGE